MNSVSIIYCTFPDAKTAHQIGRTLVEEKLIACINILPQMQSIYWWQDKIEESSEVVGILKTSSEKVAPTIARFKSLHPYKVPCAIELPIHTSDTDYLNWLTESLK